MTVSHGVEGQLISEARICIYSDIKALSMQEYFVFYDRFEFLSYLFVMVYICRTLTLKLK